MDDSTKRRPEGLVGRPEAEDCGLRFRLWRADRVAFDRFAGAECKLLYFGDSARLPYGNKSRETIARYTVEAARFLEKCGAEILVIGCNTASALALYDVKSAVEIPVIGVIEPGADHAAELSRHREAIVIATENTVGQPRLSACAGAQGVCHL